MISFRFHLVSLVAVFLALGLGVLTGTTVLNRGIVERLERQTDQLAEASSSLRERLGRLQDEVAAWDRFGEQASPFLIGGRLDGVDVIVVTQEGTDAVAIERVRRALEEARASVTAVLSVGARMALGTPDDVADLGAVLATVESDPDALIRLAAEELGARLSEGGPSDVIRELLAGGFVLNRGPGLGGQALADLGGGNEVVVVVSGGVGEPLIDPARFLVPLVERMAAEGVMVGAAEPTETAYPFVTALRNDGEVAATIVTQDNVDARPGEVGLVLALEDLIASGRPGHFGVKPGAEQLIPPLT